MNIDIIIFAAISFYLFFRLWQALGTKTGAERKPDEHFWHNRLREQKSPTANGRHVDVTVGDDDSTAKAQNPLSAAMAAIKNTDPNFSEGHFLRGARIAFDMIFKAFSNGDKQTLQDLLDQKVYQAFAADIDARKSKSWRMDNTLVRLRDPEITDGRIDGEFIYITVSFKSEQVSVTRDNDGKTVDGDADRVYDVHDIWVFRRNYKSNLPNWYVVETRDA